MAWSCAQVLQSWVKGAFFVNLLFCGTFFPLNHYITTFPLHLQCNPEIMSAFFKILYKSTTYRPCAISFSRNNMWAYTHDKTVVQRKTSSSERFNVLQLYFSSASLADPGYPRCLPALRWMAASHPLLHRLHKPPKACKATAQHCKATDVNAP